MTDNDIASALTEARAQNVLLVDQLEAARQRIKTLEDEVANLSQIIAEHIKQDAQSKPQPSGVLGALFRGKR